MLFLYWWNLEMHNSIQTENIVATKTANHPNPSENLSTATELTRSQLETTRNSSKQFISM